ncbi:purine-cytosine permease family protein [Psychrobacillus sp. NPDC093180]|uniref:purine-cytosine permease family protein n=1 Tax=Psychrobacillus sp. NPDC093180 TaxID=3364489 RepID=UPI00382DA9F4
MSAAKNAIGDDYSLSRVPQSARKSLWSITIIRVGAFATISQFILGATMGYGMTFTDALIATFFGSIILQVVGFLLGYIGVREGLSTSLLTRWAGFGKHGGTIFSIIIAISCIGWFGVQNTIFASGLVEASNGKLPLIPAMFLTGLSVTFLVIFGFKLLSITAAIAVPAFLLAVSAGVFSVFHETSLSELFSAAPAGEPLSIGVASTMIAGGFIVGAIITPDISRFARSGKDVFWMTTIGLIIGELGINMIAVLLALAARTNDVVSIMVQASGIIAALVVVFSTIKINNVNLYAASLSVTSIFDSVFNVRLGRAKVTLVIGIIGTVLSAIGILNYFIDFLVVLGVLVPPVAGIIIIDYFILKTSRQVLDESRERGELPSVAGRLSPITIIAWAGGFLVGYFVTWGIPSLNALFVSGVIYYIGGLVVRTRSVAIS